LTRSIQIGTRPLAACLAVAGLFSLSAPSLLAQAATTSPTVPAESAYTLDQVLTLALDTNSSVRLAREKVIKSQQLIYEANAAGLPQVRVDIVDTYSSSKGFGTAAGGGNSTGTLPGGGQIPVIIDTGGGNTGAVTSSGGGGTATGAGSSSFSSPGTNSVGGGGTISGTGVTNSVPTNSTLGSGGTSGLGTIGNGSITGTGAAGTGGVYGTTGPTANPGGGTTAAPHIRTSALSPTDLPPIMQSYNSATKPATNSALSPSVQATPHDSSTGNGTGTQTSDGSISSGSSGYHNNYSGRISITQGIDLFKLVPAAQEVENFTREFYVTDLIRVQNETALSVKNLFFTVLRNQAQVGVYQQQITADTESVRVTQARVTAGAAARYDLLTAQTTLSNAQQQLSSSRNTLALAVVNLNNLIGIAPSTRITLIEPQVPSLDQTFDVDRLTQSAYQFRPEIKQADNNILIAQRLIKLAGSSLLPSFSIVGTGNYNGHVANGSNETMSLSAVLGIPLYDGGTTRAKVTEAQSDLRSQQITRNQLRQNVSVEILQALSNINDAQSRAASATVGAAQAEEALRLANVRYQNGIGTILDVVNADAQLSQARTNSLNAQYDYQTSLAQLTRGIGGR